MTDLQSVISENEKIIWKGKPNRKCFILESAFNPLLPFALLWAIFDLGVIGLGFAEEMGGMRLFFLGFFALHLMPVWIYLAGIIFSIRRYKNTEYIITDVGVYISGGTFSYSYQMKPFAQLSNISLHRGIFDQWLKVGDVVFDTEFVDGENKQASFAIINIENYQEIYKLVKEMQKDIHADTMYPNDLRPKENHGYNTEYKK